MAETFPSTGHLRSSPTQTLPIEIIHQIASYLPSTSIASFSLTARFFFHALGTSHLHSYLHSGSKYDYRKNIEILERAFPSQWFCAWCGRFHEYGRDHGPRKWSKEETRDCAESNGYLHDGEEYVVLFHHVRLAVERVMWGEEFGIDLAAFDWTREGEIRSKMGNAHTKVDVEARVVLSHLLLHSTFVVTVPTMEKNIGWARVILDAIPQIVGSHGNIGEYSYSTRRALEHALIGPTDSAPHLCPTCATDYHVCREDNASTDTGPIVIKIESWRDLGSGRNPFDTVWRAHGEMDETCSDSHNVTAHPPDLLTGQIMESFEQRRLRIPSPPPAIAPGKNPVARSFDYHFSHDWVQSLYNIRAEIARSRKGTLSDHEVTVAENNEKLKADGPLFEPPYGLTWSAFVDLGGMRGRDGIRLNDEETRQLASENGLWGRLIKSLSKSLRRDAPEPRRVWWLTG